MRAAGNVIWFVLGGWYTALIWLVGAAIFALATQVWHLHLAMALIGIGCAPALMAAYYILAHEFPPAVFAGMTGLVVGFGSLGDRWGSPRSDPGGHDRLFVRPI